MKKIALSLSLLSICGLFAAQEPAAAHEKPLKIGYIRIEQIFNEKSETPCHEIQDKIKSLQNDLGKRQKDLQAEQQKLEKEAADLETGDKTKWTSEATRESKRDELLKRQDEWKASARRFQEYASRQQQKVQNDMLEKIMKTANAMGEKQGYDIIMASGAVYVSKKVDITASVVSKLNAEYNASKVKKEAKPAAKK